jgi:hypothetical protein
MDFSQSGDVGYCMLVGHTSSLVRTWQDGIVTAVSCDHEKCGHADQCEMYRRGAVGYHFDPSSGCGFLQN